VDSVGNFCGENFDQRLVGCYGRQILTQPFLIELMLSLKLSLNLSSAHGTRAGAPAPHGHSLLTWRS
jgi:hypothetical protein